MAWSNCGNCGPRAYCIGNLAILLSCEKWQVATWCSMIRHVGWFVNPLQMPTGNSPGWRWSFFQPPNSDAKRKVRRLHLRDLIVIDQGFATSASAAMLFALVSESLTSRHAHVFADCNRPGVDAGDHLLLSTLVLAFGLLAAFQIFAGAMRQLTFQFLSQTTVFSLLSGSCGICYDCLFRIFARGD